MKIPVRRNLEDNIEIWLIQKLSEGISAEIDSALLNEIKRLANEEK